MNIIKAQNSDQNFFICVENQCNLNRVITNWDQLQQHNSCDHKILPKNKFESKVKFKLKNFNQQQSIQFEEDLFLLIEKQEQQIIQGFQQILEHFKKTQLNTFQKLISIDKEQENILTSHLIQVDLQKYINIFHDQMKPNQQQQVTMLLDEIQFQLNCMNNEFLSFFNFLEQNFLSESQFSININKQDASKPNIFPETQQLITNQIIVEENEHQKQNIYNKPQKITYEKNKNREADQDSFQQQSFITNPSYDTDDQNELESIPLKGYKCFQQQQNYHSTEYKKQQYDDIKELVLPQVIDYIPKNQNQDTTLKNERDLYEQKVPVEKQFNQQDQYEKKNFQESSPNEIYYGVRFDMFNSDKKLIYYQNYESFKSINEGIGLVEGVFSLQNDAEINLIFSECQNKTFNAEIGILQVNKYGQFNGSLKQGRIIYGMDEQGNLISRNRQIKGNLKISLNQEYLISYSSKKRILYFIRGEAEEYFDVHKVSGNFKFYVKLCGVKVTILN
ncbi:unnamed protein product [Paramecium sonneborni]|uniref:Uncharacterized protein n=1 Tax=Paramecium sonneborni TaxID=65129 RepID=A0A8S1KZU0_9CILI|nr:unnamed protein product [Paramecium sonneborni]